MSRKKMKFNKNKEWELCTFYQIYMQDNIKMIRFIGITDKADMGKNYLSWICTYCADDCEMPLEEFLLWGVYYQKDKLFSKCNNIDKELEPYECYEQANEWVKGNGEGSVFSRLLDLTEETPCGYYYGY